MSVTFAGRAARAQVDELLGAHAPAPTELLHHDRPLEDELTALLVAERDGPAPELVEAVERVDQMAEERVAPQLAVADDVEARGLLQGDRLVHGAVLDALERRGTQAAGLTILSRLHEGCRP